MPTGGSAGPAGSAAVGASGPSFDCARASTPAKRLSISRVEDKAADLVRDLMIPEALRLWSDDPERRAGFARGTLDLFDRHRRRLKWRFRDGSTVVTLDATPEGVEVSAGDRAVRYTAEDWKRSR
jgi:hypothetical protein